MRMLGTVVVFTLLAQALAGAPRVRLQVPHVTTGDLLVQAFVEPAADNRSLEISIDSGQFYRSSEMPLEGADAPRVAVVEFGQLPSGEYEVIARLLTTNRKEIARSTEHVFVG